MRTMVLVYLPTNLGDFGQGQMLDIRIRVFFSLLMVSFPSSFLPSLIGIFRVSQVVQVGRASVVAIGMGQLGGFLLSL